MTVDVSDQMQVLSLLLCPGDDPYPAYAAVREHGPVRHGLGSGWLLAGFDQVSQVLRDTVSASCATTRSRGHATRC